MEKVTGSSRAIRAGTRDHSLAPVNAAPSASESKTTLAADWFAARQRGERLPEHELEDEIVAHNFMKEQSL